LEKLIIQGGNRLEGRVRVSSAKNAVLPIIAGTLLASTPSKLLEIPNLEDVGTICQVIESLGVKIARNNADGEIVFDASTLTATEAPYELVRKMRASFLVMGPLLARKGEAKISMPGGCAIGARPIDLHLKAFEALGAKIEITEDYVYAHAPEGLKGTQIYLDFPSVGATENVIMAASMAKGKTVIENAAEEPEIVDLATFLNAMGANIRGAGTNVIRIEGVPQLNGAIHTVIPDRIEAGTYLIAAAMAGGDVFVENALPEHLKPVVAKLKEAGVTVEEEIDGIRVISSGKGIKALLGAPFAILRAVLQARKIIKEYQPNAVLGMGGYVSGPGGIAAKLCGVPVILHEQNAVAGLTNEWLAKIATRVLQAFPTAFKDAEVVGNPVRQDLFEMPSPQARFSERSGKLRNYLWG